MMVARLLPAVYSAQTAAPQASCTQNLGQIGLALFNYESDTWGLHPRLQYVVRGISVSCPSTKPQRALRPSATHLLHNKQHASPDCFALQLIRRR
jgi:hypothetical protein